MRKLLRPQDMLLLGLANVLDVFEELKDPLSVMAKGYQQMYGFVPPRYKKNNFNHLVWRSLKTGYIEKVVENDIPYLRLTSFGKKRVQRNFPLFNIQNKKWDKKWRIVSFDIEEINSNLRKRFREKLKELGFGMLQESVFITPNDIIEDFAEFVEEQDLSDSVYIMEVSKIVGGDVKSLVNKVWKLEELNERYIKIFKKIEESNLATKPDRALKLNNKKKERNNTIDIVRDIRKEYLEVLLSDPFLPKELLPDNWMGEKVKKLMRNLGRNEDVINLAI